VRARYITFNELKRVCDLIGETVEDAELREMISEAGGDAHKGKVTHSAFLKVCGGDAANESGAPRPK